MHLPEVSHFVQLSGHVIVQVPDDDKVYPDLQTLHFVELEQDSQLDGHCILHAVHPIIHLIHFPAESV